MNSRQINKRLSKAVFHDYEKKGRKIYSYKIVHDNLITLVFTAKPKQKGCGSYSEKYILEELNLYGHKAAYELILIF